MGTAEQDRKWVDAVIAATAARLGITKIELFERQARAWQEIKDRELEGRAARQHYEAVVYGMPFERAR